MRHLIRSVKYLVMLVLVYIAATYVACYAAGKSVTLGEAFLLFKYSGYFYLKLGVLIALCGIYPLFGYVKTPVKGDVQQHRQQIASAMNARGFRLKSENNGELIFKANNIFKAATFLFEDKVVVSQRGENIVIDGPRRCSVYAAYLLDTYISNSKRGE